MSIDFVIVLAYLVLTVGIGLAFRKMGQGNVSNYFRGGGNMAWWMVGATAFMTQFSAWTFTGAASKAYADGFIVVGVFVGNLLGFWVSYKFFAAKFRQARVDTGGDLLHARFGKLSEQVYVWLTVPLAVVSSGVALSSLAVLSSVILKMEVTTVIWITGITVTAMSMMSGAWGVVASDFVQSIIVLIISVLAAIMAMSKIGGVSNMINDFPVDFWMGPNMNYPLIIIGTFLFFFIKQVQTNNTMFTGYRYFAARDTKNARKGAIFALCAMAFGTIIWFLPPWVAASIYPDAATHYSGVLGSRSREAVYLVFVERALPAGAVGLLVASLFAATMSTLDSALNRDVGVVIKSFYRPILRPNASSKELMTASLLLSGLFGLIIILMSQYFNTLKELSLFELSMQVATIAQAPMLVPLFFGVFIRKTPDWAAWATVIVGVIVSVIIQNYLTVPVIANAIGFTFTGREVSELVVMYNIFMHLVITGGFFCLTTFFYKEPSGVRKAEIIELFANMDDPVVRENTEDELMIDQMQRSKIGVLVMISGTLIFLLTLVPNPLVGRLMYFVSGLTVLGFGYILKGVQKKIK